MFKASSTPIGLFTGLNPDEFLTTADSSTEEVLSRARRSQEAAAIALHAAQSSSSPPARDREVSTGLKQPHGVRTDNSYAGVETDC
jgi:hypothetical protein